MGHHLLMRRSWSIFIICFLLVASASPASARAQWKQRIDRLAGGHSMSIAVRSGDEVIYRHKPSARRAPASGEKLLMSMALLDAVGPDLRFVTSARVAVVTDGVVQGNLWLFGKGDPSVTAGGSYGRHLPFRPTRLSSLARKIKSAGIRRITGSVSGAITYFSHDWWASGWKSNFPAEEVALPSALAFEGNTAKHRHVSDPEFRAARGLTRRLEAIGVRVKGRPQAGRPTGDPDTIAKVASAPLKAMMRFMNRQSSNFFAEMLGKRLAVERTGTLGTIANGAAAIESWAAAHGVNVDAYDSSGLSYSNRTSPLGFTRLLASVESESWWPALRSTLAGADQGTLDNRLQGVRVRAKTGTLTYISSLSGWVWLRRTDSWASFSIMSNGMYKSTAAAIEDQILRELTRGAR